MADQEQEPQVDYRLEVLRAAGHEDAAELLSKLPVQTAETTHIDDHNEGGQHG